MGKKRDPEAIRAAIDEYLSAKRLGRCSIEQVCTKLGLSTATFKRHLAKVPEEIRRNVPKRRGIGRAPRVTGALEAEIAETALANPDLRLVDLAVIASQRLNGYVGKTSIRTALRRQNVFKRRYVVSREPSESKAPLQRAGYREVHRREPEAHDGRPGYPSDFTEAEWTGVEAVVREQFCSVPTSHSLRSVLEAIRYVLFSGCPWRALPHDFPPYTVAYEWFVRWSADGSFDRLGTALRRALRRRLGKEDSASLSVVDSQSVRAREGGSDRGYDGGKKIAGRKRHMVVDTEGLLMFVAVHSAQVPDRDGIDLVLPDDVNAREERLKVVLADAGYAGKAERRIPETKKVELRIARRPGDNAAGGWVEGDECPKRSGEFKVVPVRWVVERSFHWFSRRRRLTSDFERRVEHSRGFFWLSATHVQLARHAQAA